MHFKRFCIGNLYKDYWEISRFIDYYVSKTVLTDPSHGRNI